MIEKENLTYQEIWRGDHKDVSFEIRKTKVKPYDYPLWTYYLMIPMKQVPEKYKSYFDLQPKKSDLPSGRIIYSYMSASIINNLDWHCGITFYEKRGGIDGEPLWIKIGCDYNHYWDEEVNHSGGYSFDWILKDVENTINKLHELISNLYRRCSWNGKFYAPDQGKENEKGVWISFEGEKQRQEYLLKEEKRKEEIKTIIKG